MCVCVLGRVWVCYQPDRLSNGGNRYGGVVACSLVASPSIHQTTETVLSLLSLAALFLNFPVIIFYVPVLSTSFPLCSLCPASASEPPTLLHPLSVALSRLFPPLVVLLRTAVLNSSSVTAPLHILCMLYRQPNGGNQSTQMRLDSVCTSHSNQSSSD